MSKLSKVKINDAIRALEVRVISDDLGNLGVMKTRDAIAKARELGQDLIEISPDAVPPVAKIADYGKFSYGQSKKQKEIKVKTKAASVAGEVKNIQIKIGTGDNDIAIKAKGRRMVESGFPGQSGAFSERPHQIHGKSVS